MDSVYIFAQALGFLALFWTVGVILGFVFYAISENVRDKQ